MKKSLTILLVLLLIFSSCFISCGKIGGDSEDTASIPDSTENTASVPDSTEDTTSIPDNTESTEEDLDLIREQFEKEHSLTIKMNYTDLGVQGFEVEHSQIMANDGSFRFDSVFRQWIYASNYDSTSTDTYYYYYEGDDFICYSYVQGEISKGVMTEDQIEDLWSTYEQSLSGSALLPEYISDFHETTGEGNDGERSFAFTVALKDVNNSSNFLSSYFDNMFSAFGKSLYSEPGLNIYGVLTTDSDLRPIKLSYDFSEIEPHVLSAIAWSEEAIGCLSFEYTFDFDLAEHIEIPEVFIS